MRDDSELMQSRALYKACGRRQPKYCSDPRTTVLETFFVCRHPLCGVGQATGFHGNSSPTHTSTICIFHALIFLGLEESAKRSCCYSLQLVDEEFCIFLGFDNTVLWRSGARTHGGEKILNRPRRFVERELWSVLRCV